MLRKLASIIYNILAIVIGIIVLLLRLVYRGFRNPRSALGLILTIILALILAFLSISSRFIGWFGSKIHLIDNSIQRLIKYVVSNKEARSIRADLNPILSTYASGVLDVNEPETRSKQNYVQNIQWGSVNIERNFRRGEFSLSILISITAVLSSLISEFDQVEVGHASIGPIIMYLNLDQLIQGILLIFILIILLSVTIRVYLIDVLAYRSLPIEARDNISASELPSVYLKEENLLGMWLWNVHLLNNAAVTLLLLEMTLIKRMSDRYYGILLKSLNSWAEKIPTGEANVREIQMDFVRDMWEAGKDEFTDEKE